MTSIATAADITPDTRTLIFATAGHVDHGKTSLVHRLTGTDTDTLKEEKQRGLTINLGFAYAHYPDENLTLGFVDVPGHSDFINNMTHEFKTPLATIGLAVDSMRHPATKGDEERQEYYAQLISDEKKRLTGHIEKILQLAKMDRGDIIIKPERFSCEQLLNEAVTNMQLQADARDGSVRLVVEDAIGDITADRSHLYNAVINLLDNAIKYSEKPPQVVLMAKKQKDGLKIIVEDNGIGMSSEDQKRVLETFYRAQTGDVHDVKGFGLGLSYVKEIVNLHRGEMIVKSILGSGSQIGFQIPTSL